MKLKERIAEFNKAQGSGIGSFKIVAYWSRGDMSMSMLVGEAAKEKGKKQKTQKENATCLPAHGFACSLFPVLVAAGRNQGHVLLRQPRASQLDVRHPLLDCHADYAGHESECGG